MTNVFAAVGIVVIVSGLILVGWPFLFVAAANELFNLSLQHGFWNYLSFWVLAIVLRVAFMPISVEKK